MITMDYCETVVAEGLAESSPKILVAPEREDYAVDAVRQGGGVVVDEGDEADGVVWMSKKPGHAGDVLAAHPGVRWVQWPIAGMETVVATGIMSDPRWSGVTWTCAKGSFARPVAEHALALALAGLRGFRARARASSWGVPAGTSLYGADVALLGGGGIAVELLRLLAPFEVRATVVRKQPEPVPGAARTVTTPELRSALPGALVVFVAAALSPETVHLVAERELSLMGADSWLVNVGRGRLVDTDALVEALSHQRIGGAALDVTDPEPLPDGHPLWSLPNCFITPHTADTDEMCRPLLAERIRENVERLATGLPLVGTVDPVAGY
jgi:phosphoglycerate dehydrogenase-like enzyme